MILSAMWGLIDPITRRTPMIIDVWMISKEADAGAGPGLKATA